MDKLWLVCPDILSIFMLSCPGPVWHRHSLFGHPPCAKTIYFINEQWYSWQCRASSGFSCCSIPLKICLHSGFIVSHLLRDSFAACCSTSASILHLRNRSLLSWSCFLCEFCFDVAGKKAALSSKNNLSISCKAFLPITKLLCCCFIPELSGRFVLVAGRESQQKERFTLHTLIVSSHRLYFVFLALSKWERFPGVEYI